MVEILLLFLGILPTFGPCWINFFGSPRNYTFMGDHEDLDEGLGEGAAYKGRILMSIKCEIMDGESGGPSTVLKERLRTSAKVCQSV